MNPTPPFDLAIRLPAKPWYETPMGRFAGFVNPLPVFNGQEPVDTGNDFDEEHPAVDLGYVNQHKLLKQAPQVFGGATTLKVGKFFVPSNSVMVVATGPGRIWFSGKTNYGWTVRIDHGTYCKIPVNSYVTHMSKLLVPEHNGPDGPQLYAGQPIGICGEGGTNANHVHFELWDFSTGPKWNRPGTPLDPRLYLPHFGFIIQS